jgi:hypothetical protein
MKLYLQPPIPYQPLDHSDQRVFVWIYFKKLTRYHLSSGKAASICHCPLQGHESLEHLPLFHPRQSVREASASLSPFPINRVPDPTISYSLFPIHYFLFTIHYSP